MKMLKTNKVCQSDAQADVRQKWAGKFQASAMAAAITALICASVPSYAADLEIYKVPEDSVGAVTLMFMLDISGSMSSGDTGQTGSRMARLKNGMTDALRGTSTIPPIEDKLIIGISEFENNNGRVKAVARPLGDLTGGNVTIQKHRWYRIGSSSSSYRYATCMENYSTGVCKTWGEISTNNTNPGTGGADGNLGTGSCDFGTSCRVYYTNETRAKTHRDDLLTIVAGLNYAGNTPTPYAYAEAAAYLMGTNTLDTSTNVQAYFGIRYSNKDYYQVCSAWTNTGNCNNSWNGWYEGSVPSGYTKGASGTLGGYNGNYYLGVKPNTYSGFNLSIEASKNGSSYSAPTSITEQATNADKRACSSQGIYFLTDGAPVVNGNNLGSNGTSGNAYELMKNALGTKGSSFNCNNSPLGDISTNDNNGRVWACIGKFAEALLDSTKNPTGVKIQTAVVGFGNDFNNSNSTGDVQQAKNWGTTGGGGWYSGASSQDIVNSINSFIHELDKDIPSMSTGSSTIPMDSLNPEIIQPYAYFPQFEPKVNPEDTQQLWFGNLKKYYVINNGVYSVKTGGAANTVVKESKLQDLADIWADSSITYPDKTPVYKKGGVLSRLLLGINPTTSKAGRKILTEYAFDGTKTGDARFSRNFDLTRIDYTYTTDAKTKTDDASRVRGLMALLGYNIASDTATNGLNLTTVTANLRQMGSIYHSLPVLLTQEGKAVATKNATSGKVEIDTTDREDYVMFGTTQGALSVVDKDGKEKFAFIPKEMIENQSETFKENAGSLAGGKNALYYGLDGEWVAHTVYVAKPDGTLTVKGTVRNMIGGTDTDKENLQGKQWVYGGMRMGGRSYYALDLTDIDNPKLKFHIDPTTGKVYSADHPSGKAFPAISNMAQSWSKPKLDYVNWKGQRTLVMFVGGGYDAGGANGDGTWASGIRTGYAGYEHYDYKQTNGKGAGVYMFDANTGDLLWSASSSNDADLKYADLKYSVASEIKTVDRNNDGMVDHIYFGDLAGQAFRADFLNDGDKTTFSAQVSKILNVHQTTSNTNNGTSPRFYLPPTFTAHYSAGKKEGANIVVASFVSGNKSSPLLATSDSPTTTGKQNSMGLQYDAVYAVYENDIHPDGSFYPTASAAKTLAATNATTASLSQLKYISNDAVVRQDADAALIKGASPTAWGGWYYRFDKKFSSTGTNRADATASIIKGLSPLIAMEGSLYVSMYDASNNGTSSSCGAGVKGHTFVQRLCLPTGVCPEDANYMYNLGSGIVAADVGSVDGGNTKALVVPDPADIGVGCVGAACGTGSKFITSGGSMRFIPNRWYERYAAEK